MKVNSSLTDSLLRSTRGTSLASDCLTPECQDRWWLWWWWWADLKSVCAFFFIFFSPVLFLFICFSPAWEAAPSPPPQYQAQLRQVSPPKWYSVPISGVRPLWPFWSFLSILLVATADQSWIQATSPRQSEGMMEIQPDDRGNGSSCGNNSGSSCGNNGQKAVYNDGSNRADNDFVYESCCRWEPFVCHSFFEKMPNSEFDTALWYQVTLWTESRLNQIF